MRLARLPLQYLQWHYGAAFADLARIFSNYLWFLYNLFSISYLLETFFDPFERIRDESRSGADVSDFFSSLLVNTLMRIVGMCVRFAVILIGIVLLLITLLIGAVTFLLWPFVPLAIVTMIAVSIPLLI